jgi:hypothetical protein
VSDDRTVKKVFLGKPDGRIKVGKPILRWLDCNENGLKSMAVKRWRKKAEDRSVCAIILKKALIKLQGPYAKEQKEILLEKANRNKHNHFRRKSIIFRSVLQCVKLYNPPQEKNKIVGA